MTFVYLVSKLILRARKDYDGNKVDLPSRNFGAAATIFGIQTREPGDPGNAKSDKAENTDYTTAKLKIIFEIKYLPTLRRHEEIWRLLDWNCTKCNEIKEKLNFRICPNSTISLLVSRSDMPDMRCFSISGIMKNQHDAILESFGTTEEIIVSPTHLPSTTYSLHSSSLALFKFRIYAKSNYDLAAKSPLSKIF